MEESIPVYRFPFLAQVTLQHATEMVLWTRSDGSIIYGNATLCEKLGFLLEELLQLKLSDLLEPTETALWSERWKKLQSDRQQSGRYEVMNANDEWLEVQAREYFVEWEGEEYNCIFWQEVGSDDVSLPASEAVAPEKTFSKQYLLEEIRLQPDKSGIISQNRKYRKVLKQVEKVADTHATVLIQGETGTGKELLADAIHQLSDRRREPFVKVNCAAIPEHLAGSELFGHEKGAFTGAFQRKIGRFELADGGTLLLDEVGELPLHLQPKLLRVLQSGEFERLGGNKSIKVDVRLVAATNRDLKKMIREGTFREDLFFRLSVFPIYNLPLRERKDDIPLLVKFFIEKFNQKMGKQVKQVQRGDMEALSAYDFPGNIRELENIIERAVILSSGDELNLKPFLLQNR